MVVGAVEVTPVLDAIGTLAELRLAYPDVPADEWAPYRALYPELFADTRWRLPTTAYILRAAATTVLVDTGLGPPGLWTFWEPEREGLLPAGLRRIGIPRERVDIVFLTHLHIDHVGWNTDENGDVLFPRARYVTSRDALSYALSDAERPHIRRCVAPLADRFEHVEDGADLVAGVSVRTLPGHCPGHMGLSIRSEGSRAELIGDLAPHPALLDRTEWVFAFDEVEQTPTRAAVVEELVDSGCIVICGHYPGSGIGRVATRAGHVVWQEDAA